MACCCYLSYHLGLLLYNIENSVSKKMNDISFISPIQREQNTWFSRRRNSCSRSASDPSWSRPVSSASKNSSSFKTVTYIHTHIHTYTQVQQHHNHATLAHIDSSLPVCIGTYARTKQNNLHYQYNYFSATPLQI